MSSILLFEVTFRQSTTDYIINPTMDGAIANVELKDCRFATNIINEAVIILDYVSYNTTDSELDSHTLLIEGIDPIDIELLHIQTSNMKVLHLHNDRTIENTLIWIDNSQFSQYTDGFNMYIIPKDEFIVNNCIFDQISTLIRMSNYDSTMLDDKSVLPSLQLEYTTCEFKNIYDQIGLLIDSNEQDWMPNITISDTIIYNNSNSYELNSRNNITDGNANTHITSATRFVNIQILESTNIVSIWENTTIDNNAITSIKGHLDVTNCNICDSNGYLSYYKCPNPLHWYIN